MSRFRLARGSPDVMQEVCEHPWVCSLWICVEVNGHGLRTPDRNGKHWLVRVEEEVVELLDSVT